MLIRDLMYERDYKSGKISDLSALSLPEMKGITTVITNNTINLSITHGPFAGKSMVLGVYSVPNGNNMFSNEPIYYTTIDTIFLNFPGKYLSNDMALIQPYLPDR
ncbi:MAG: hypothetical protein ABW168_03620 [Sedimenticola sp.]